MIPAVLIGLAAFAVSTLTLFTGFGLGTMLLPAFALVFPMPVAIGATAIVHLANNLFKVSLLRRDIDRSVALRFGLPAVLMAFVGAGVLALVAGMPTIAVWHLGDREHAVTPIKLVIGVLIIGFGVLEGIPRLQRLRAPTRWLPVGGALSGFFGGLSGHQGALRAVFLAPLGLTPAAFAATQAVIASVVDLARVAVYGASFAAGALGGLQDGSVQRVVAVSVVAAFAGAVVGRRLLPKVTIEVVRQVSAALLLVIGAGLAAGVL